MSEQPKKKKERITYVSHVPANAGLIKRNAALKQSLFACSIADSGSGKSAAECQQVSLNAHHDKLEESLWVPTEFCSAAS